MAKAYILYNPLSGDGKIRNDLSVFEVVLDEELVFADITEAGIGKRVRNALQEDDYIILCGGDAPYIILSMTGFFWISKMKSTIIHAETGTILRQNSTGNSDAIPFLLQNI